MLEHNSGVASLGNFCGFHTEVAEITTIKSPQNANELPAALSSLSPKYIMLVAKKKFFFVFPDSSGHVPSSPLGSPTSHRGMHPPLLSPTSMGPSGSLHSPISTLSSPMNGLASPYSVISSPMGPHSMNSPGMGYGSSVSPQVRALPAMNWVQKLHYLFMFTYAAFLLLQKLHKLS